MSDRKILVIGLCLLSIGVFCAGMSAMLMASDIAALKSEVAALRAATQPAKGETP